jgi:hypothetical protein
MSVVSRLQEIQGTYEVMKMMGLDQKDVDVLKEALRDLVATNKHSHPLRLFTLAQWLAETDKPRLTSEDMVRFGHRVASLYRSKNGGQTPPKLREGRISMVNTYCDVDIPLIEAAWESFTQ